MRNKFSFKLLSLFVGASLFCFLFLYNVSPKNATGSAFTAMKNLNIATLQASADYTITCDATNTNLCIINTPEGQGRGTGDQIQQGSIAQE